MSIEGYRPPYKSEAELKALLRQALDNAPGQLNETFHARYHHLERGLTADDVAHGLEQDWHYEREPEFNEDQWQWKYRIATESVDGDRLTIIIAVDSVNKTFEVVTRWNRKE